MNATRFGNWLLLAAICVLISSTGCRNRVPYCQPGYYNGGPLNGVLGSTTVPSPSTYSINIPGQNPSYYNANATAQVPTPATGTLPGNPDGWRQAGSPGGSTLPSPARPAANSGSSTSNQGNNQSRLTSVIDRPVNQVASNNGLSFTNDSNFRTTAVDERLDQSRLPVTDASQVRAPTTFTPTTTVGQFNNPYYNQTAYGQVPYNQQVRFAQANPVYYQQQVPYSAPTAAPNVVVGSFAQPTFTSPPQQNYYGVSTQHPQVLAQSTVRADPVNNPNYQNGWRDRDLTASRDSLNR